MPSAGISCYKVENIEIDPTRRCIRRDGAEDYPRSRVFDLLLYLIENRERPVTKQELVERVWNSVAVTDSVLYKTVLEVRRVLGNETEEDPGYVKTLPKLGYQFVAPVRIQKIPEPGAPAPLTRWWIWLATAAVLAVGAGIWFWASRPLTIPDAPDEEVAWWRFAKGSGLVMSDSAGTNHGKYVAAAAGSPAPHWADGRRGSALRLNGGEFVEGRGQLPAWSAMTAAAWIRPNASAFDATVFDSPRLHLYLVPSGIFMGRPNSIGATRDLTGRWHHVVAVDEGPLTQTGRLFIDGVESASGFLSKFQGKSEMPWRIGQALSRSAPYSGLIDDLRLYARPLRKMEIEAIYRCGKEQPDLSAADKGYYFLPIFAGGADLDADGSIVNRGPDLGRIQFAEQGSGCDVDSLRGADLGQDLRLGADLLLNRDDHGHTTEAGLYFRSRRAYPGDGIAGGESSGYWLKLFANGQLQLWQLKPFRMVGASAVPASFDAARYHRLEAEVRGVGLTATLDGVPVDFEQDGRAVRTVEIQETGPHRGTAGVAFSADANRGALGGQRARALKLEILAK